MSFLAVIDIRQIRHRRALKMFNEYNALLDTLKTLEVGKAVEVPFKVTRTTLNDWLKRAELKGYKVIRYSGKFFVARTE